ncbi:NepR family anti-sigma factor [Altererythrobacter sp.]|nr:NepR family anti-sigma factor [Altererythrobacter sp.]
MNSKSSQSDSGPKDGTTESKSGPGEKKPEWANGLRELYDSVVEEPLPDSFADLLSKLDDEPSSGDKAV